MRALALDIGWRYLRSARSSLSAVSLVAVGGLALSVAVLLVVTSIVNGFDRELRTRILGVLPHMTLMGRSPVAVDPVLMDELVALPSITGAAPIVHGPALAAVAGESTGIALTGIDPDRHPTVSELDTYLPASLGAFLEPGAFSVILGGGIARTLGVGEGDAVTLILPDTVITPAGVFPRQRRFTVTAVLETRSELDARHAFIHLADARRLFRLTRGAPKNAVHGYQLATTDLLAIDQAATAVLKRTGLAKFYAITWLRTHGNLYQAIALQKVTMYVLLTLLVGVAAFNLVSTLVLVVAERRSDVAILQTLGAPRRTVLGAFLTLGGLIGAAGSAAGVLLGLLCCALLPEAFAWLDGRVDRALMSEYLVNDLPVDVRRVDVLTILFISFVLCLASTVYPAYRATRIVPSRVLAHE